MMKRLSLLRTALLMLTVCFSSILLAQSGNNNNTNNNNTWNNNNNNSCRGEITGVTLVHSGSGSNIGQIYDGAEINVTCGLNVRAEVACPGEVKSVDFRLNGNTYRVENRVP